MRTLDENLHASILDRLIDYEPDVSVESVQSRTVSFRQIKDSVMRDIENLLNTKQTPLRVPSTLAHLQKSLFVYGLKDFTADNPSSPFTRQRLRQEIQKTIALFEPRLKNVSVHIESYIGSDRGLRFRISGLLVVEPISEPVVFDTRLDANRNEYVISR